MNVQAPIRHEDPDVEHARSSDLLRRLADGAAGEEISIREMMEAFGERSFGVLMILFCLPNLVPLPGVGSLFGIPLLFLALQMAIGRTVPWLPAGIAAKSISRATLVKLVGAVEPRMRRVEAVLKPRYIWLFSSVMDRVIGWFATLCAISIIIPFPGTNFLPAVAVILISLAVTEEDGVYLGLGFLVGTAGLVYTTTVVGGLAYAGLLALGAMIGL